MLPEKLKNSKFNTFRKKNPIASTLFALAVMVILQAAVMAGLAGSFSGMWEKLGMAWLNILRNNVYSGLIALGMCFAILSGGIDLSVGSMLCALLPRRTA